MATRGSGGKGKSGAGGKRGKRPAKKALRDLEGKGTGKVRGGAGSEFPITKQADKASTKPF